MCLPLSSAKIGSEVKRAIENPNRPYGGRGDATRLGGRSRSSARAIQKPPQQQIAQERRAGAQQRKCRDYDAEFDSKRKRRVGVKRPPHLDERRQQAEPSAAERRTRHVPRSPILCRPEKRWKHVIARCWLHRGYRPRGPASRAALATEAPSVAAYAVGSSEGGWAASAFAAARFFPKAG